MSLRRAKGRGVDPAAPVCRGGNSGRWCCGGRAGCGARLSAAVFLGRTRHGRAVACASRCRAHREHQGAQKPRPPAALRERTIWRVGDLDRKVRIQQHALDVGALRLICRASSSSIACCSGVGARPSPVSTLRSGKDAKSAGVFCFSAAAAGVDGDCVSPAAGRGRHSLLIGVVRLAPVEERLADRLDPHPGLRDRARAPPCSSASRTRPRRRPAASRPRCRRHRCRPTGPQPNLAHGTFGV